MNKLTDKRGGEYVELVEANIKLALEAAKHGKRVVALVEVGQFAVGSTIEEPKVLPGREKYAAMMEQARTYVSFTVSGLASLVGTSRQNAAQAVKSWSRAGLVRRVGFKDRKRLWSVAEHLKTGELRSAESPARKGIGTSAKAFTVVGWRNCDTPAEAMLVAGTMVVLGEQADTDEMLAALKAGKVVVRMYGRARVVVSPPGTEEGKTETVYL